MNTSTNQLVQLLREKNLCLALVESVTCGLASHQLSTCIGTTEVFKGSIVCYAPEVKTTLLKINAALIRKYTAESQQVTDALAARLGSLIEADIYGAITGLAAPGGSESRSKPVGTIFISVMYKGQLHKEKKLFRGTPTEIRKKACLALYKKIIKVIDI